MSTWRYIHELPAEAGAAQPLPLTYDPVRDRKHTVHILALGDVGMTALIGLRLLGADCIQQIGICDLNTDNVQRLEMELNQVRYPFPGNGTALPPVYAVDEEHLFDCDVFLFCASKGVPPVGASGDVRMAQLEANRGLIGHFATLAKKAGFSGLVCIISDPVDPLCKAFWQASGLEPSQIRGYGLGVMHARACYYAEKNPAFQRYSKEGRAFGPHGEDLVLADSLQAYDEECSQQLTHLAVQANRAVRALGYKPYIAPALSSAALSVLLTLRRQWQYSSVYFGDREHGAFFGIRNKAETAGVVYEDAPVCPRLYERIKAAYLRLCQLP